MKLLIIEDEHKVAESLAQGLREAGYGAVITHDGYDGLYRAESEDYDLIVLDLMLPGMDGLSVLTALRQFSRIPVLMLSARNRVEDKVSCLRAGADDYLAKPFAFSELLARIESILRRGRPVELSPLQIGDLLLDPVARQVVRGGRRILLTSKEFALLHFLSRSAGRALSRSAIALAVWGVDFDTDTNTVEVAVRRLRAKIDDDFERKLVVTVRGVGYKLDVPHESNTGW